MSHPGKNDPAPQREHPTTGIRILSFDGGGVRGLSSLIVLEEIMKKVQLQANLDEVPYPCAYFDLICGTSTGGLIALMLGRLRMSVRECIEQYVNLSAQVFVKPSRNMFRHAKYHANRLERQLKKVVASRLGECTGVTNGETEPLEDPLGEKCCKTFVLALRASVASGVPLRLRTYRSRSDYPTPDCTIWQAARATSAAPSIFDPVTFGVPPVKYVDGGLGYNNPSREALAEASRIWPGRSVTCLVSIGTGLQTQAQIASTFSIFGHLNFLVRVVRACVRISTDCERVANDIRMECRRRNVLYFRFNVRQGLDGIGLEEHGKTEEIGACTREYLSQSEIDELSAACASQVGRAGDFERLQPNFENVQRLSSTDEIAPFQKPMDLFVVPHCRNPFFTGRGNILKHIATFFECRNLPCPGVFALCGLSGVGKTQIAVEFAYRQRPTYDYIHWIRSGNVQTVRSDLVRLTSSVMGMGRIERIINEKRREVEEGEHAILAALTHHFRYGGKWLLIFDNVNTSEELNSTIVTMCSNTPNLEVHVLVTSRDQSILVDCVHDGLEVPAMTTAESIDFLEVRLLRHIGNRTEEEVTSGYDLIQLLGGLPLALEHASAYIRKTQCTISEYVEMFKSQDYRKELMGMGDGQSKIPISLEQDRAFRTWELSIRKLEETSPGALALFNIVALLDGNGVHEKLIRIGLQDPDPGNSDMCNSEPPCFLIHSAHLNTGPNALDTPLVEAVRQGQTRAN